MTDDEITQAVDARYRGRGSWLEFLDSPCHMEMDEPIASAIALARRLCRSSNATMVSHVTHEIVGLMLESFEAGQVMAVSV